MSTQPAEAVAAAKCFLARRFPREISSLNPRSFHPRSCFWCEWTPEEILSLLERFAIISAFDGTAGRYTDPVSVAFTSEPAWRQAEMVREAQYGRPDRDVTTIPDGVVVAP